MVVLFVATWEAKAQDTKIPYPSMVPLEQYLIPDRNEEIKLARSAAPDRRTYWTDLSFEV